MNVFNSNINLQLPLVSSVREPITQQELQGIYAAFQILQVKLTSYESRIKALEDYNIAHP